MTIAVWIVQGIVAVLFLLAGFLKVSQPLEKLAKNMNWVAAAPPALVRFIGTCELLGAVGLILPTATGTLPWLTVAAAIGLALIMLFAAVFHASRKEYSSIGMNAILLLSAVFVVVGRGVLAPIS